MVLGLFGEARLAIHWRQGSVRYFDGALFGDWPVRRSPIIPRDLVLPPSAQAGHPSSPFERLLHDRGLDNASAFSPLSLVRPTLLAPPIHWSAPCLLPQPLHIPPPRLRSLPHLPRPLQNRSSSSTSSSAGPPLPQRPQTPHDEQSPLRPRQPHIQPPPIRQEPDLSIIIVPHGREDDDVFFAAFETVYRLDFDEGELHAAVGAEGGEEVG